MPPGARASRRAGRGLPLPWARARAARLGRRRWPPAAAFGSPAAARASVAARGIRRSAQRRRTAPDACAMRPTWPADPAPAAVAPPPSASAALARLGVGAQFLARGGRSAWRQPALATLLAQRPFTTPSPLGPAARHRGAAARSRARSRSRPRCFATRPRAARRVAECSPSRAAHPDGRGASAGCRRRSCSPRQRDAGPRPGLRSRRHASYASIAAATASRRSAAGCAARAGSLGFRARRRARVLDPAPRIGSRVPRRSVGRHAGESRRALVRQQDPASAVQIRLDRVLGLVELVRDLVDRAVAQVMQLEELPLLGVRSRAAVDSSCAMRSPHS